MTLLATIFPNDVASDFDLEAAIEAPKRLVHTWEDAVRLIEGGIKEGRDEQVEWKRTDWPEEGQRRIASWKTECNEYGTEEEWLLVVEDVPFGQL